MKRISIVLTLSLHLFSMADTCTDDYIISGGRAIDLLPDKPFQIIERDNYLIVIRDTLVLNFINLKIIENGQFRTKRYSLIYLNDEYFFDIIEINNKEDRKWEQYAAGSSKRGFGGICLNK
jgi:hypothetical protein